MIRTKSKKPKPQASLPVGSLPRVFNAQKLSEHLGISKKTVLGMGFPKYIHGTRTHLYFLDDVLARLAEIKREGGHR